MSNAVYAPLEMAQGGAGAAQHYQQQPFQGQAFNAAGQPIHVAVAVPVAAYPISQQQAHSHSDAFAHASAPYAQQRQWVQVAPAAQGQFQQQQQQQQPQHQYPGYAPLGVEQAQPLPLQVQQPHQFAVAASTVGQPGHVARGRWSDGLFGCFSALPICLVSTFLLPLRWAQTIQRVQIKSFGAALALFGIPWILPFILGTVLDIVTTPHGGRRHHQNDRRDPEPWMWAALIAPSILCNLIVIIVGTKYRGQLRARFGIPGSVFEDCLSHTFCRCCAVAQEARHVDRDFAFPL